MELQTPVVQVETIEQQMEAEPIKCFKYNYTLD